MNSLKIYNRPSVKIIWYPKELYALFSLGLLNYCDRELQFLIAKTWIGPQNDFVVVLIFVFSHSMTMILSLIAFLFIY